MPPPWLLRPRLDWIDVGLPRDGLPTADGRVGRLAVALPGFRDATLLVLRLGAFDVVGRDVGLLVAVRLAGCGLTLGGFALVGAGRCVGVGLCDRPV
jgi:hypothetical protein